MSNRIRFCLMASFALLAGCANESNNNEQCTPSTTRCESGMLQTCVGAGQWLDTPCTLPLVCTDVSGVAQCMPYGGPVTCTAGIARCNNGAFEKCDGTQWNIEPCNGTCVESNGAAFCQAPNACTAGLARCNNGILEKCDGTQWNLEPCNGTCIESNGTAFCQAPNACTAGLARCNNGMFEKCDGTQWNLEPCNGTCVESNGTAFCQAENACSAGLARCNNGVFEKCDGTQWNVEACNGTCIESNGTAFCQAPNACTAGLARCNNGILERCDGTQWNAENCNGACVESNGTAVCQTADCTKGEVRCNDDGSTAELWTCNDNLTWNKTPCPASEIEGARLSCRNASSCSTILCGEGMIYNSEEKKCQSLAHSNACTAGRTYCNGKTNVLYECLATGNEAATAATDCTKDGMACVKISDDEAQCLVQECESDYCDGEKLIYCTSDHKKDEPIDCTESERICYVDENGVGSCEYPECVNENEIRCISDDDTHTQYQQCINKRWSDVKTCPAGILCEKINGTSYCAECHDDDEKCEDVEGSATHFTCSEQYKWEKSACPDATPVCDENHKSCTEEPDVCGNAQVGAGEDCDGSDLGTAQAQGDEACKLATGDSKATGTLSCYASNENNACHFNTSECKFCGNNIIDSEIEEVCDGNAEITMTCADVIPNTAGTLKCSANCQFDTSECSPNYQKITAIYKDYDKFIKVNGSTSCSAQTDAPKAGVSITGIITAILPDKTGFYIQGCDADDTRGIFVYLENSIYLPNDMTVGSVYSLSGGLISNYRCGIQIKRNNDLTISPADKVCTMVPKEVKIEDILAGPKADDYGSLVVLKGEKAIAYRSVNSTTDNQTLNVPGGEKGWRLGTPGIGSEITVSSYLLKPALAENAMTTATKYNVTGIVVQNEYHMGIAPRSTDEIVVNECIASCSDGNIFACDGDTLVETAVSCATHLGFDGINGSAVCAESGDDCVIKCDTNSVLVNNKCIPGYLETFDFVGETPLSNTTSNASYASSSFTSASTGLTWDYTNARNALCSSSNAIDGNGLMFKKNGGTLSTTVDGGVSTIKLQAAKATTGDGTRTLTIEVQGTRSNQKVTCPSFSVSYNGVLNYPECEVKIPGEVVISVKSNGPQTNIDNIQWMSYTE